MAVLDEVYRQILELRRERRQPVEVRVGQEDYYDLLREAPPHGGPLTPPWDAEQRVFGVPLRRLPIRHGISVI